MDLKPVLNGDPVGTSSVLFSLHLDDLKSDDSNWGHLIAYLAHQTSGGQMISLEVIGDSPCVPPEVVNEVEGLVEEFTYHRSVDVWGEYIVRC